MQFQGLSLDPFQKRAIEAIDAGRSVLVSAPTGNGKTLIADYLTHEILEAGGGVVYTAPVKALSNQKYREYSAALGEQRVGLITGDIVINPEAPLRIMTTEILRNMLLLQEGDIDRVSAVILDELHYLDDPQRGTVWEEVLIYLPARVRILGLSATLSNIAELAAWLSHVRATDVAVIRADERVVPLRHLVVSNDTGVVTIADFERAYKRHRKKGGRVKHKRRGQKSRRRGGRRRKRRDAHAETGVVDMVRMLDVERDMPALFFIFSRRGTEVCATKAARATRRHLLDAAESRQLERALDEFEAEHEGVLEQERRDLYCRGIAFHHAGLDVRLKLLVESLYEARLVKLLFCTSTFALGINMPARTVLFETLEKFNGEEVAPLTVRQFMQKAGRAGRRGLDAEGQVMIRCDLPQWTKQRAAIQRLTSGKPEPVRSAFNLSFHSVVNLLSRYDDDAIADLLDRSFLAWQLAPEREATEEAIALAQARVDLALRRQEQDPEGVAKRKTAEKRLAKLQRRLAWQQGNLWQRFTDKRDFLTEIGYLGAEPPGGLAANRVLNAGASLVAQLQIEEIYVAELVLAGIFEELAPEEIFAVCVGLIADLPRRSRVHGRLPRRIDGVLEEIEMILEGGIVFRAVQLAGGEPTCDPQMMVIAHMWATGMDLESITRRVSTGADIAGDLVGSLRRGKDLASQLIEVLDDGAAKALKRLLYKVARDPVGYL